MTIDDEIRAAMARDATLYEQAQAVLQSDLHDSDKWDQLVALSEQASDPESAMITHLMDTLVSPQ